jgi:hypothetical protein
MSMAEKIAGIQKMFEEELIFKVSKGSEFQWLSN